MTSTPVRLLALLGALQSRPQWSATELAARFDVTTRTVRNDIERLRELGYPVETARGRTGGYRLGAGASLPPLLLDDDEAVAVTLGLRAVAGSAIERVAETSARALAKLDYLLPSRLRRQVAALSKATVQVADDAGIPDADPQLDPDALTAISLAIRDAHWLRFEHDGVARLLEPYRLVSWERRWYLLGRDPQTNDWPVVRVDAMTLRTPTHRPFRPRPLPMSDVRAYVMRAVAYSGWKVHARVTVLASADEVRSRINAAVGIVDPIDESSCVLVTGADSVGTLAVYLGLLDLDVRVTEPPELVERMRTLATRYAAATA
ncbi:helix-turn-helix transcriptional regulator [Humibacter ginsenosidimutans]|uniref:WYL domain-containing protein n=1 Tax=Humibacter ginsenosidimutans TaxID=2599293 RepID=A0A5B8M6K6_9MICO|nr:WYL domain-containing protein [Humibacter ginsenosidimutans]QDZ15222.1 WYL domain-containing protein [Humibacter ginsenosidimutans]